jgi:hypothetical protein
VNFAVDQSVGFVFTGSHLTHGIFSVTNTLIFLGHEELVLVDVVGGVPLVPSARVIDVFKINKNITDRILIKLVIIQV